MAMIKLKINSAMRGHKAGDIIKVEATKNLAPKDKFWRRRLKDAKQDNCVSIYVEAETKNKKAKVNKKTSAKKQTKES